VMEIATAVSAIAACVIVFYAWQNYKTNYEFRRQVGDLYQAIVISTLISGPTATGSLDSAIESFKSKYKGKTRIFD